MKKLHLRLLSGVLATALFICSAVTQNGIKVDAASVYVAAYNTAGAAVSNNLQVATANDAYGQHIKVTKPFDSFRVPMQKGSGGDSIEVQLSVYEWKYDFQNTLRSVPKASISQTVTGTMRWYEATLTEALPAGEYLFHISCYGSTSTNRFAIGAVYNDNGNSYKYQFFQDSVTQQSDKDVKWEIGFTQSASTYFDTVSSPNGMTLYKYSAYEQDTLQSDNTTIQMGSGTKRISQRVKTSKSVYGFGFVTVTWGSKDSEVTLSAYQWNHNYSDTLSQAPIVSNRVWVADPGVKSDRTTWVKFDQALPSGEYLFVMENAEGHVGGVYALTNNTSGGYAYIDGAEMAWTFGLELYLSESSASDIFVQVQPVYSATGSALPPEETVSTSAQNKYTVKPDTWVFTDGLGRESLTNKDVGNPKTNKNVAMFYWDWHQDNGSSSGYNIQKTIDAGNTSQLYSSSPLGSIAYWNEPLFGYYASSDRWVLRKHSELLANAGIDTVFLDYSNAMATHRNNYISLYEEWMDAMNDGVKVPKISYYLPMRDSSATATQNMLKLLYSDLYQGVSKGSKYQKLWFYWAGKPMLIAKKSDFQNLTDLLMSEINGFFTFRNPDSDYTHSGSNIVTDTWGWSSIYPQTKYKVAGNSKVEEMAISPAQNWNYSIPKKSFMNGQNICGRSYTNGTVSNKVSGAEGSKYGYNLQEQFNYALNSITPTPDMLFITGWNEWTVGRSTYTGVTKLLANECNDYYFMDQYNDEYSRDIEPSRGELKDHYYYQVINNIRRYKGVNAIEKAGSAKKIVLNKNGESLESQWENVTPYYAAYQDNIGDRDSAGRVATITDGTTTDSVYYKDKSGRNDIVCSQVARDMEYVYFNVECKDNITAPVNTDSLWMNLYLDTDQTEHGWETFDYVVRNYGDNKAELFQFTGTGANSYNTVKISDVDYELDGKYLTVKIPKSQLGLNGYDFTVNFSWTDNVHDDSDNSGDETGVYTTFSGDIMDFYTSGDVAPGGRFKYSYISTVSEAQKDCGNGIHSDDNGDGKCDACGVFVDGVSSLAGYSARIKGNICFDIYLELISSECTSEAAVLISYPNGEEKTVLVSEAEQDTQAIPGKTLYVFSSDVAAKEMTDDITLQVFPNGTENAGGTCYHCSVSDYAYAILNNQNINSYSEAAPLIRTMLHYGGYAQQWFSHNLENLADKLLKPDTGMSSVTAATLSGYSGSVDMSALDGKVSFNGFSLLLQTDTTLRYYFTLADGVNPEDVSVTYLQNELEMIQVYRAGKPYYCVDLSGISAQDLDNSYEVQVDFNGDQGTVNASALGYCYLVLKNPSPALPVNLVKALYLYNRAAKVYFE